MKILINTQYRENYAAHNEDWVPGVSEDYWKFKGGSTYVVPNFKDYDNITEVMKNLDSLITYGNPASEEYIIDWNIADDSEEEGESWETVTQIFIGEDKVTALRVTDNREDGYMRSEILEKTEAWTMCSDSERADYSASFLMSDGDICDGEPELRNWFEGAAA